MRLPSGYFSLIFVSALMLAQSNPVSFTNQLGAPSVTAQSLRDSTSGQRGTRASKAGARQHATSQTSGLSFATAVVYGSGGDDANSVAVADLNGDGKADIVVANCGSGILCGASPGSVGVLLGNGDGTFQTAVFYSSGGYGAASVAIADVNGDGKPDLLVANNCSDATCATGSVSVLLGNGDGTFNTAVAYNSGGYLAVSVAVADVNGDKKPDLVVINSCSNNGNCVPSYGDGSLGVLLGNGDGTFQTAVLSDSGGYTPQSVAIADLNGDGKPDAIIPQCYGPTFGCITTGQVGVLLGNGDGTFQAAVKYNSGADYPNSVAVADVNGDGKLDVLLSNEATLNEAYGPGVASVLLGNGDGTLQAAVTYSLGGNSYGGRAYSIAVADMNLDGKLDLVVSAQGDGNGFDLASVLLGNGDGTFQTGVPFMTGGYLPVSVAVADVNGDGRPDLVVANQCGTGSCPAAGSVGVLINTGTTVIRSPGSLNFAPQAPGTSSSPQTVTLTNRGTAALTLSGISLSGTNAAGFTQTNNCPSALAVNASCQVKVTSVPQSAGGQTASLNIADNAPDSPQTVALTGIGQDFSVAVAPGSMTVTPGQAGNYTVIVSPLSGFSQKIALTCSGAPPQSSCTVSPNSVTLNGSSNATASVAVVTSGTSAAFIYPRSGSWRGLFALGSVPLSLGLVVLWRPERGRGRSRILRVVVLLCLFGLGAGITSCGGGGGSNGGGSGTPAGSYVISVTGTYTSGGVNLTHIAKTTLVVQ